MKGFNPHLENTRCRGSFLIATRYAIKEPIAPRGDGNITLRPYKNIS